MADLESIYATQPFDSDDSWRTDYASEDPLLVEREWDTMMRWEKAKWPEKREEQDDAR